MDDWTYCLESLPKVSRTFALNISVLRGELHRSILTAYLFCRTVDTVEDASRLDADSKIKLLLEFAGLIEDPGQRKHALDTWIEDCKRVDGSANDLDLLAQIRRVFNTFDSLKKNHQQHIVASVAKMARGMAYFQQRFEPGKLNPLQNQEQLEEYCYFVAGIVGEMLCNLFLEELPGLSEKARETMKQTAVSFGLGLQITNISKDVVADRNRGWSYIPQSFIAEKGLTVEEFHSGTCMEKNLQILEKMLHKTSGHLQDALRFTLAIPRNKVSLRLFCIWPLWMAMETVSELHNNPLLLKSDANVKISRTTVKRILKTTPWIACSNSLLTRSFNNILKTDALKNPPQFDLDRLKERLQNIPFDSISSKIH